MSARGFFYAILNFMEEKLKNIVLTGFRATGKSLVGRLLAASLGYTFIDADILLCARLGAPIAEIVASHGWSFFRHAERQLLLEIPGMEHVVLATGGGAIEHQIEWQQLRHCCYVVWLDAEIATIRQRMMGDPKSCSQRPSLTGTSACDEIEELLRRRTPLYSAGSDMHLKTDDKAPATLVVNIIKQVQSHSSKMNGSLYVAESNEQDPHSATRK